VPFVVRDAAVEDVPALQEVFRRSSLSNLADREDLLAHPEALEFAQTALGDGRVRVATDQSGRVIGFATTAMDNGRLELVDLFVDPDWMRRGVGRRLLLDAVGFARTMGIASIGVTGNHHAYAFYAAVGFVWDEEVVTEFGSTASRMHLDVPT
jgi:GNAT superfamily N-acetyltransferase